MDGMKGPTSGRPSPPPHAEVRAELERVLASPGFRGGARRRAFLRFVVEEALAGREERLKGVAIAVAVFGRDETFDQQADPVVRSEARRLRRDLDGYYSNEGRGDPVRISIPKGGYAPCFEWRDLGMAPPVSLPDNTRPRRYRLAIAVAAAAMLALSGWLGAELLNSGSRSLPGSGEDAATTLLRGPKIAVLPLQSLSDDPGQVYFARGITEEIVTDLARFKALFVVPMQSTAKYQEQSTDPRTLRQDLGIDYLLVGNVQRDEDHIKLSTHLVDAVSDTIVWAGSYNDVLTPSKVFEFQEDIARQVSAAIASRYGVIAEAGQTEASHLPPRSLSSYECVLRYYAHQRSLTAPEHATVRACLERAVETDPDYADAWAVLANVYAQEIRHGLNPRPDLYDPRERSLAAAERAVAIDPRNPTAQVMLANALFDRRDFVGFRLAEERALALNPNDPDILAHYGLRLVYMGELEGGQALVAKAIALNPDFPEWYRDPLIFYSYQTGDYERALAESQKEDLSRVWPLLFRAMILGQLGRGEEARPMIEAALRLKPDVRERFWDMVRVWNVPDSYTERMADGLRKAGLEIPGPPSDHAGNAVPPHRP